MRQQNSSGLTLVEILVALVVLAISVLGISGLLETGLRASAGAETSRQAQRYAEGELAEQMVNESTDCHSIADFQPGFSCRVIRESCAFVPGSVPSGIQLDCREPQGELIADLITVTVDGPRGTLVTLSGLVRR